MTIPGFTHPVRPFWIEDALEQTGYVVGRDSKWAKKKVPSARPMPANNNTTTTSSSSKGQPPQQQQQQQPDDQEHGSGSEDGGEEDWETQQNGSSSRGTRTGAVRGSSSSSAADGGRDICSYSYEVQRSVQVLDPAVINTDLIEALLVYIVTAMKRAGPGALLKVRAVRGGG
jgi:hypothetical protein